MMFSEPVSFEREFVERTKSILQSYNGDYETTLFINAMLGLFIIPKEKRYDEISDEILDGSLLEKIKNVTKDRTTTTLPLKDIVRRMRNAIAHGHIVFEAEKDPYGNIDDEIQRIMFYDDKKHESKKDNYNLYEFSAEFSLPLLREFVDALSEALMRIS